MGSNRVLRAVFPALMGAMLLGGADVAATASTTSRDEEQHILVTFNAHVPPLNRRAGSGFKGYANTTYTTHATARYLTRELAAEYSLQVIDNWPMDVLGVHCVLYRVSEPGEAGQIVTALRLDSRIESVQPMQRFHLQAAPSSPSGYNDPYHELQRGWWDASLSAAHRLSTGRNVTVGVIDTAVERQHQDLRAALAGVKRFVPDERGSEGDYHGTSVAGIIAAEPDNGVGIVGIAPGIRLFSLEACWPAGSRAYAQCDSFTLAKALNWAIKENLQIINLSLAGPDDPLLGRLIDAALQRGISIVAADAVRDGLSFPASRPGVIAVREVENHDESVMRHKPVFYAPGRDVMTTVPRGTYDFVSGSSMAAAHVSGLIALMRAYDPSLSGARVHQLLQQTLETMQSQKGKAAHTSIDACSLLLTVASAREDNSVHSCVPPVLVAR